MVLVQTKLINQIKNLFIRVWQPSSCFRRHCGLAFSFLLSPSKGEKTGGHEAIAV